MNKKLKILIAILGGIEAVFYIGIPILISITWVTLSDVQTWSSYILIIAGILASVFRGIKVGFGGFIK